MKANENINQWNISNILYENDIFDDVCLNIIELYGKLQTPSYNESYDIELHEICKNRIKALPSIIKSKKKAYLWNYVMQCTEILTYVESITDIRYNISYKVKWTLEHRNRFPVCYNEKCNTKILYLRSFNAVNEDWFKFCNNNFKCENRSSYHKNHVANSLETHYGIRVPAQCPEILHKMQRTCIKNFGYANPFQQPEFIARNNAPEMIEKRCNSISASMMEQHGVLWYVQSDKFLQKVGATNGKSKEEKEIADFIKSITLHEVTVGSFKIIPPKQLDVYIKDLNLAFEFNGTYYHSIEWNDDVMKHLEKTKMCEELGIKLVHIWEDEWAFDNLKCKKMIEDYINGNAKPDVVSKADMIEIDRSKFNKCFLLEGYELVEESLPDVILRSKQDKSKYRVPDCGKLIYKKIV